MNTLCEGKKILGQSRSRRSFFGLANEISLHVQKHGEPKLTSPKNKCVETCGLCFSFA